MFGVISRNAKVITERLSLPCTSKVLMSSRTSNEYKSSTPLEGKSAVVTASTDGIGLAIAKRLVLDGANVVVSSRKQKNVDAAVELIRKAALNAKSSGNVCGIVAHVGKSADRTAMFDKAQSVYGKLDILVSNAAVSPVFCPTVETGEVEWDKIFEINLKSAFLLVKEAVPKLADSGDGSIVFISSIAGFQPFPYLGAYSISKTALLGLTKVLASELAADGIRVNSVSPGVVKTKFAQPLWASEPLREMVVRQTAAKRIAEPDEISGIVSFLCSKDAGYITGENIVVASGMQSRL